MCDLSPLSTFSRPGLITPPRCAARLEVAILMIALACDIQENPQHTPVVVVREPIRVGHHDVNLKGGILIRSPPEPRTRNTGSEEPNLALSSQLRRRVFRCVR